MKKFIPAIALIFALGVISACGSTEKANTENTSVASRQSVSQANEKPNIENRKAENQSATATQSKSQTDGLPALKKGEDYKTSVRPKMLKAGWKPARSNQADICGSQEPTCDEFEEYESKTGKGITNFRWQKGNKLAEISASGDSPYVFETYQIEKDGITVAQRERWNEFWNEFKAAINKKDKQKLKLLMTESIDGGGAFETSAERLAAIEEGSMWETMQKTVSEGTKLDKCEKPCRSTKDGYLIFEYEGAYGWKWTALGGEGQDSD